MGNCWNLDALPFVARSSSSSSAFAAQSFSSRYKVGKKFVKYKNGNGGRFQSIGRRSGGRVFFNGGKGSSRQYQYPQHYQMSNPSPSISSTGTCQICDKSGTQLGCGQNVKISHMWQARLLIQCRTSQWRMLSTTIGALASEHHII